MKTSIQESLADLAHSHAQRVLGTISTLEHSRQREAALARALVAVAADQGVILQEPLHIDALGEYSLVALRTTCSNPHVDGSAQFGRVFAELLSRFRARMGIAPGHISDFNGWCHLNHFEAERLVKAYAQEHGGTA
jgi:hypothetical protein